MKLGSQLKFLIAIAIGSFPLGSTYPNTIACKCTPNTSCFPSEADWRSLNASLHGTLIAGVPLASVCYHSSPFNNFDQELCADVSKQWFNSSLHAANPISIDYPIWANNSCNPVLTNGTSITGDAGAGSKGCSLGAGAGGRGIGGGYPYYVVNASSEGQIGIALKWARQHNVRIVIKNTGHNFVGRSTAWGSLSIWTHNLKSFQLYDSWTPTNAPRNTSTVMAASVGSGLQDFEAYALANASGAIVVGGSNPTVGLAGWMQGGGHGPLSSTYGMGSDNLLEARVVLASGEAVTANKFTNTDLYWALRGGGGGTFGVVTHAIYYDLMGELHHEMIAWKAAGLQGYYGIQGPPTYPRLFYYGIFYIYDKPESHGNEAIASFKNSLDQAVTEGWLNYTTSYVEAPTYYDVWSQNGPEYVATGGATYGSRLINEQALNGSVESVSRTLQEIGPRTDGSVSPNRNSVILGHMIANSANRNLDTALNPAWRDAVTHMIVTEGWVDGAPQAEIADVYNDITFNKVAALKRLAPNSGAYFNEPDVFEPDWQSTFFGRNYPRLSGIKKKYDPEGLFWCRACVGSDDWVERDDGKLCQAIMQ